MNFRPFIPGKISIEKALKVVFDQKYIGAHVMNNRMCSFCKCGIILTCTPLTIDRNNRYAYMNYARVMFTETV